MKIEIISDSRNELLRRREVRFKIVDCPTCPTRIEARKMIASFLGSDLNCTFIIKLATQYGLHEVIGEAEIYDSEEDAKAIVPKHIQLRNAPKEAKEEKG